MFVLKKTLSMIYTYQGGSILSITFIILVSLAFSQVQSMIRVPTSQNKLNRYQMSCYQVKRLLTDCKCSVV